MADRSSTTAFADPLILTAMLDARSFATFDRLRAAHFPPELNIVPAHLTLFHALPGTRQADIAAELAREGARLAPMPFAATATRLLGRGVAFEVDCPRLARLRHALALRWGAQLGAQDKAGFRPHVTVQNKVSTEAARALRPRLDALLPLGGTVDGLCLWHYRGGPWEAAGRFPFASRQPEAEPA